MEEVQSDVAVLHNQAARHTAEPDHPDVPSPAVPTGPTTTEID